MILIMKLYNIKKLIFNIYLNTYIYSITNNKNIKKNNNE